MVLEVATRILMLLYCLLCACVGVIGFGGNPSAKIADQLGYWAVMLYSTILIISGLIGALGIFRNIRATVISVWAIAAATFFHGAAAWGQGSPQTGLRLMIAPLMMVPLVWAWEQWLRLVHGIDRLTSPQDKR